MYTNTAVKGITPFSREKNGLIRSSNINNDTFKCGQVLIKET